MWDTIELDRTLNTLVETFASATDHVNFIDTWTPMTREACPPPERYFVADHNHLSEAGYAIWVETIRKSLELNPGHRAD